MRSSALAVFAFGTVLSMLRSTVSTPSFSRIGFSRLDFLDDHLVGLLGFVLIAEPQELFDQPDAFLFILFAISNAFEKPFDECLHHRAAFPQKGARSGDAAAMELQPQLISVDHRREIRLFSRARCWVW